MGPQGKSRPAGGLIEREGWMRVVIGQFARSGIEAHLGPDLAGGVQAALRHYSRRLRSGTAPVEVPRVVADQRVDAAGASFELPVERRSD